MSDAGSVIASNEVEDEEPLERRVIPTAVSAMAGFPSSVLHLPPKDDNKEVEPKGWWGSRDVTRPWRERPEVKRRPSVPPEQSERWEKTRKNVSHAVSSTLDYSKEAAHDLLEVSADVLRFAPIPGLEEAARVLLTIWDALQLVETNRLACLRLTERCADILLAVRQEIYEAGGDVGDELKMPLTKLIETFKSVHVLLHKQVHRPFLKRYLKRDDILRSINGCDAALTDAISLFSLSIQIRTLRQLQEAESQRKADTDRLIASLSPQPSRLDLTPKQGFLSLPPEPSPPAYTVTSSSGTENSKSTSGSDTTFSSNGGPVRETVQSPPPTPDSQVMKLKPSASQVTIHAPPSPEEIRAQLCSLVEVQNSRDHALDMVDLRTLMRAVLATSSDAEMIHVLQINREEMPEALKTLQRALEQELEKEEAELDELNAVEETGKEVTNEAVKTQADKNRGTGRLSGLTRRLTMDSVTTRDSKRSKSSKEKGIRRSPVSDTLDREFIETGIDALRRLSRGQDINLPNWTITRFEVDLEERVGVGYFSDVYRGRWRNRTVAVKVLTLATPKELFVHEMAVWRKLSHPNVLPLLGASSATGDPPWFLVSPYMHNGNLVEYMRNASGRNIIDSAVERKFVYEVAKGMAYLHRQGVMHGDLKGSNVLISDEGHCFITDFGQSEMKSEAFRLSGRQPPRGTLRWQAPEIVAGESSGQLTYAVDIYAFAIVCVEIFGHGALPWAMIDNDQYSRFILEDKRPPITNPNASPGLINIIEMCWVRDPSRRPTFQKIVRELKKLGLDKYTNSPAPVERTKMFEDEHTRRPSPDMKPGKLPDINAEPSTPYLRHSDSDSAKSSPGPSRHSPLLAPRIPIQRIITPISEEDKRKESKNASPVSYRPDKLPEPIPAGSMLDLDMYSREHRARSKSESAIPSTHTSTTTSRTGSTSDSNTESFKDGPGLELERFQSPPPADEIIAQRKNESRYRLCLQHPFHPSLTLPLWDPSPVELGAVGYLSRPNGEFVTLFNAFDPPKTSGGRADGMSNLYGYGKIAKGSQRQDRRDMTQRGLDAIRGLLWFRSRNFGDYQQSVSRRVSFPIRANHKSSFLYVEQTTYKYVEELDAPKKWFEANIQTILTIYGKEHRLQKEDVYLIIGTLNTPDYGLFVNHNNPDGQVHFNVFTSPKAGQKWGAFAIDTSMDQLGGPSYHEDVPGKTASANKVSEYNTSSPWNSVLLARLRFRPDEDHPTAL